MSQQEKLCQMLVGILSSTEQKELIYQASRALSHLIPSVVGQNSVREIIEMIESGRLYSDEGIANIIKGLSKATDAELPAEYIIRISRSCDLYGKTIDRCIDALLEIYNETLSPLAQSAIQTLIEEQKYKFTHRSLDVYRACSKPYLDELVAQMKATSHTSPPWRLSRALAKVSWSCGYAYTEYFQPILNEYSKNDKVQTDLLSKLLVTECEGMPCVEVERSLMNSLEGLVDSDHVSPIDSQALARMCLYNDRAIEIVSTNINSMSFVLSNLSRYISNGSCYSTRLHSIQKLYGSILDTDSVAPNIKKLALSGLTNMPKVYDPLVIDICAERILFGGNEDRREYLTILVNNGLPSRIIPSLSYLRDDDRLLYLSKFSDALDKEEFYTGG